MAFTLNVPTLSQALSGFYPMKIHEQGNEDVKLKCTLIEILESDSYNLPNEPVDSQSFIGDTFYKAPKQITCRVFVNTNFLDTFNSVLESLQNGKGFCIMGADGQKYENMRLESLSTSQTADVQGGYFYNMAFKETIVIEAFNAGIPLSKSQKSAYSTKQSVGESANNKRPRSILKGLTG